MTLAQRANSIPMRKMTWKLPDVIQRRVRKTPSNRANAASRIIKKVGCNEDPGCSSTETKDGALFSLPVDDMDDTLEQLPQFLNACSHDGLLGMLHPYATYVLRKYYEATGWNDDNLFSNLTRSSDGTYYYRFRVIAVFH